MEFAPPEIPTFLAPKAYDGLHVRGRGITYDMDDLYAVNQLAREIGFGMPDTPDNLTFVYRFAQPGFRPHPDIAYSKADSNTPYIPGTELAIPIGQAPNDSIRKDMIEGVGKTVLQIDVGMFDKPLAYSLIQSLLFPPAEDNRTIASPRAWFDQFKEAINPRVTDRDKVRVREEVLSRFAGAVVLQPRK